MNTRFDQPFTFDRVVRLIAGIIGIALAVYIIYLLRSVLLPFLIAWLIAYLLNPIVRFVQKRFWVKNRVAAVFITLFLVTGTLTGAVILLIPTIEQEVSQINQLIQTFEFSELRVDGLPANIQDFIKENIDLRAFTESVTKENANETIKSLIPALQGIVSSTISVILGAMVIFVVILYIIFIMIDFEKMNSRWINFIPSRFRKPVNKIVSDIETNMNTYFRNQALICFIAGCLYAIGFQIIGMPLALMMGAMIMVLHMVPYLQAVSIIPAVLLCWLKTAETGGSFWGMVGLTLLIYAIIQCIIDGLLVPKIMGKATGLNPAVILLSLSIWGFLLGIVGMIIAIPLTTLLVSYYEELINSTNNLNNPNKTTQEKPLNEEIGD